MAIIVNLDMMLAKRKMTSLELAQRIGITQANLSILKTGKAKKNDMLSVNQRKRHGIRRFTPDKHRSACFGNFGINSGLNRSASVNYRQIFCARQISINDPSLFVNSKHRKCHIVKYFPIRFEFHCYTKAKYCQKQFLPFLSEKSEVLRLRFLRFL